MALNQIMATIDHMKDGRPFEIDGQVTTAPDWFDKKFEHYFRPFADSPSTSQGIALSSDERFTVFMAVFLLIALAIVLRK